MKAIAAFLLPLVYAAPAFPPPAELDQGIINPNISLIAGGGLPNRSTAANTALTSETPAGVTALQLLIALENLEAYFYSEVILNITNGVYDVGGRSLNDTLEVIERIAAQEEVHVATISDVLLQSKQSPPILACEYTFPVTNFDEFLAVANLITCANFGSIIGIQEQLPGTTASGAASTAILGAETRHDAFLRILHGIAPNPAPFDTAVPAAWAYNIGLQFTVPGSCTVEPTYTAYPQLTLNPSGPTFADDSSYPSSVSFTWDPQQAWVH